MPNALAASWKRRFAMGAALDAFLVLAGCGGGSSPSAHGPDPSDDAADSPPSTADGGAISKPSDSGSSETGATPGFAAKHAPLPQIPYATGATAGALLQSVKIVSVTWKADTEDLAAPLEVFGAAITGSAWWNRVREGYCAPGGNACVGAGGNAYAPVHVGDLPKVPITDSAISQNGGFQRFISDKSKAGHLPLPDGDTLYVFYLPKGMTVTVDGVDSCGYHGVANAAFPSGATANVPYVVIPRCAVSGKTDIEVAILAASREIVNAATDPSLALGGAGFRLNDPAWSLSGIEAGDFCRDPTGLGQDVTTDGSYGVARIWSNTSAAASHDPCAPAPGGIYYNVAPDPSTAHGVTLAVGASTTFPAVAFSDGATSAWHVEAQSLAGASVLGVSLDKAQVNNGDTVHVTAKLEAAPASTMGGKRYERFALVSKGADGKSHAWPVIVYSQ